MLRQRLQPLLAPVSSSYLPPVQCWGSRSVAGTLVAMEEGVLKSDGRSRKSALVIPPSRIWAVSQFLAGAWDMGVF